MGAIRRRRRGSDDGLESRLVWIFGSPRSGSTWLLALLTHPLAPSAGWSESPLGVERVQAPEAEAPEAVPVNEPYIPHHLAPPLFADESAGGELGAITINAFRHAQPNYFLADQYAGAWKPHLRSLILARLGAQADRVGAEYALRDPLVVIKEPNGSLGAEFVLSLLPKARLIFLLRDGRDVVDSMLDAQAPGAWLERPPGEPPQDRLDVVRRESRLWVARTAAVQRAYAAHGPELRRIVRYEDALADPGAVLSELDEWLGLRRGPAGRADAVRWNDFAAIPAEAKGTGKSYRAATPGLWRENLTADEQRAMAEVMGEKLAELSYS